MEQIKQVSKELNIPEDEVERALDDLGYEELPEEEVL